MSHPDPTHDEENELPDDETTEDKLRSQAYIESLPKFYSPVLEIIKLTK